MAKLTPEQTHDWYLAGYTSKLAGTEKGVTEPAATFSACFGDAFLTHPPQRYAELLDARIAAHNPSLWLVNTGWTGGAYGTGERISIAHTRAIIRAILAGELEEVQLETEPIFGLHLPTRVKDVPAGDPPALAWVVQLRRLREGGQPSGGRLPERDSVSRSLDKTEPRSAMIGGSRVRVSVAVS